MKYKIYEATQIGTTFVFLIKDDVDIALVDNGFGGTTRTIGFEKLIDCISQGIVEYVEHVEHSMLFEMIASGRATLLHEFNDLSELQYIKVTHPELFI